MVTPWPVRAIAVQQPMRHLARPRDLFERLVNAGGYGGAALCGAIVIDLPAACGVMQRPSEDGPDFMALPECETCGAMAVAIHARPALEDIS